MKILKLYSNRNKFNTIKFNENGFSFICGVELKEKSKNTYNGVGKTLSLILVDFCLGSNTLKSLSKLKYSFFLDIKINDSLYTIKRNAEKQSIIEIYKDEKVIISGLTDVKNFLSNEINIIKNNEISFRTILSYFLDIKVVVFLTQ